MGTQRAALGEAEDGGTRPAHAEGRAARCLPPAQCLGTAACSAAAGTGSPGGAPRQGAVAVRHQHHGFSVGTLGLRANAGFLPRTANVTGRLSGFRPLSIG